ncbi:muscarinic acetylcholine receptor M2 [Colossoma macropomum]|uniref:muscarinic acetylcholine receptor M2 n=1 Tax=Colossoma macropomum TaxID=42526 RepID=UPI0018643B27|nr:muscarinic acetylcholine receptor M2 [Colossoma macropomum]
MDILNTSIAANETSRFTPAEKVLIILGLSSLSLITIIGNVLVIVSIKVNKNLQTVNNYFLFSLACADLIIGVFSMNLYTAYNVIGHWPLGPVVCDLWLALDYVASNASVMNLLIISFDRYFCVTKPLTYPVQRTTKMAGLMIAAAWILSFVLWAPAILFWQFIAGERTVKEDECYIQFFSNAVVTFGTAIAAFYLPVVIMSVLYWQISKASRSRVRRRESRKASGAGQENRIQSMSVPEGNEGRTQSQRVEDMVSRGQRSGSDATTGEDRESENDSTSGSVLASSNQRDEEVVSVETNGVIKSTPRKTSSHVKARWAKLTCFGTSTRKSGDDSYEPANANEKTNHSKERQSLVALILMPPHKKKRKCASSRERKVTRTIMAILVAFVATWTPYNVMVLIHTFCSTCIPSSMWVMGYWLCYINSTVNPACYALCNVTFKNTFKQLLMCRYKNIRTAR